MRKLFLKKKMDKQTLDQIAETMPVLSEKEARACIGGGSGQESDPYTLQEYGAMLVSGAFPGGYVEGLGYMHPQYALSGVEVVGRRPSIPSGFADSGWIGDDGGSGWLYSDGASGYVSGNMAGGGGADGGGGGGGGDVGGSSTAVVRDGLKLPQENISISEQIPKAFRTQLETILSTNRALKGVLGQFYNGNYALRFMVGKNMEGTGANTTADKEGTTYTICFNSKYINSNGWNARYQGRDNINFDWSQVRTAEEGLVVTLVHEALHARHFAIFNEVLRATKSSPESFWAFRVEQELQKRKHSQEFIDCFITRKANGEYAFIANLNPSEVDERLHRYMGKHSHSTILDALAEYRRDFN